MINRFLIGLTLIAFCQLVSAQDTDDADKDRQYVTDQLRLSLYTDANSQSKVLKLLRSGDKLIVDEIRGPYALVTAPDGTHGWVKRGFLVSNPTASILLLEEQQKNASLFEELEKLGNSKTVIDTYEKDMDELVAKVKGLEANYSEARETIVMLEQEIEATQQQEDDSQPPPGELSSVDLQDTLRSHWKIFASVIFAIVLLTFLISKLIIEARIKSRFHGIKIW